MKSLKSISAKTASSILGRLKGMNKMKKMIATLLLIATILFSAAPSAYALTFGTFLRDHYIIC